MHSHFWFRLIWLWLLYSSSTLATVSRVITLAPNLTELAFAAGITPIAVSDYSDYPPAALRLEKVANWQGMNVERILALKPDVVLAWRGGTPIRPVSQLQQLGIKVEWIDITQLGDIVRTLQLLAHWSPNPIMATQTAEKLHTEITDLQQRPVPTKPIRVFFQAGMQPLFTAAHETLQNQIIELCGGQNIFADSTVPWPQVSREQVVMRQPDLIVIPGDDTQLEETIRFWQPHLSTTVIAINNDWLSRPGPRIMLAARQLCAALAAIVPSENEQPLSGVEPVR